MPTSTSTAAAPLRGCVVGAATGALALAAHGAAGGGYPASDGMALLLLTAVLSGFAAGAAGGRVRWHSGFASGIGVLLPLAIGQGIGHWALTGLTGHHTAAAEPGSVMFAAHLIATLICAVAITAAEQLYRVASATLRVLLGPPRSRPRAPSRLAATLPATPGHRAPSGASGPRAPPARTGTDAPIPLGEKVFDPCPTGIPLFCAAV